MRWNLILYSFGFTKPGTNTQGMDFMHDFRVLFTSKFESRALLHGFDGRFWA
jgi:hypothetical protein